MTSNSGRKGNIMFRPMRRIKQQISDEQCIEILKNEPRGILSIMGEDGYPYGMPLNHWYCEENGKIYFHGAKAGHKIDAIKANPKASYCVYDKGFKKPGEWALNINSVIIFGEIKLVEDEELTKKICIQLSEKFTNDQDYIAREIKNFLANVQCLEFTPVHMTGKLVNES